jgi:Na+/H+ antiporter NhaB
MKILTNVLSIIALVVLAVVGYYFVSQRIAANQQATSAADENALLQQSYAAQNESAFIDSLFGGSQSGTQGAGVTTPVDENTTGPSVSGTAQITSSN